MSGLSRSTIDTVKKSVQIKTVMERCGIVFKGNTCLCPFHNDKHPSMSIHQQKGVFKCWACGVGGDVIEFVRLYNGLDFVNAVKQINNDFELGLTISDKPLTSAKIQEQSTQQAIKKGINAIKQLDFNKWRSNTIQALKSFIRQLQADLRQYKPTAEKDIQELNERYVYALQNIDRAEYLLDILTNGNEQEKKDFFNHGKNEVIRIEQYNRDRRLETDHQ